MKKYYIYRYVSFGDKNQYQKKEFFSGFYGVPSDNISCFFRFNADYSSCYMFLTYDEAFYFLRLLQNISVNDFAIGEDVLGENV